MSARKSIVSALWSRGGLLGLFAILAGVGAAEESTVYWKNGDRLFGEVQSASEGQLVFQSPAFADPFELNFAQLDSLVFSNSQAERPKLTGWKVGAPKRVRVSIEGGQVLYGDIRSLSSEELVLNTGVDGAIRIKLGLVKEIASLAAEGLVYLGPVGMDGWESIRSNRGNRGAWVPSVSNALRTARWGSIFRPIEKPPERGIASFELSSSERLQFSIGLEKSGNRGPRLETWADELVLVQGSEFEPVQTFTGETRRVRLALMWDFKDRYVQVADESGAVLAKLDIGGKNDPSKKHPNFGLYLRNKGIDLALKQLRIAEWDGKAAGQRDPDESGLILTDGTLIPGDVTGYEVGKGFQVGGLTIPLEETQSVVRIASALGDASERAEPESASVRASFRDGRWFEGVLESIDEPGMGRFSADWAVESFSMDLTGLRKLKFTQDPSPDEAVMPDLFEATYFEKGTKKERPIRLQGRIVGSEGPGVAAIQWRPYGSRNASAILEEVAARLTKEHGKTYVEAPEDSVEAKPADRMFLTNGDVISAQLKSLDAEAAAFSVDFAEVESFGADALRAVELVGTGVNRSGLDDPAWTALSDDGKGVEVERENEGIERVLLTAGGYFGHPTILSGGNEIAFSLETKDHSSYIAVGLFMTEVNDELAAQRLQIGFYFNGDRLYLQSGSGANGMQFNDQIGLKEPGKAAVKILIDVEGLKVIVNDVQVVRMDAEVSDRLGSGIVFANAANGPFVQMKSQVSLSQFSVKRSRGVLVSQQVNEDSKSQALTVPRMRRERPSSHALIARNGDLLRGRLEGVTGDEVGFLSRLETFTFPRERIGAIVWLKEPPAEGETKTETVGETAPPAPTVLAIFNDGSRIGLEPRALTDQVLAGTSSLLGECRVPVSGLRELRLNGWTPKTEQVAYEDWELTFAPEPVLPEESGGTNSEMVGKKAPDLELPILGEKAKFDLQDHGGKVVVLDFWATWCGPCIRAIPGYLEMISDFGPEEAILIGVNQGEAEENVSEFLVRRGDEWTALDVVMDGNQSVGAAFGVEAIPHTVIVDTEGNIAWVETGFREGAAEEMKALIHQLLGH